MTGENNLLPRDSPTVTIVSSLCKVAFSAVLYLLVNVFKRSHNEKPDI